MFGRYVIYSPSTEVNGDNVLQELDEALKTHTRNAADIQYLYDYYKGDQPILDRTKDVRPEINNTVVENHALEIVDFKKGYVFGEPVQYVRRGNKSDVSDQINKLNDLMNDADKAAFDSSLAEWFFICGTAYRFVYPKEPIMIETLDPRDTFVVYSTRIGKEPLMGVTIVHEANDALRYCIYTPNEYFEVMSGKVLKTESHALGAIPIIEYPANNTRMGAFEIVLNLLDALNKISSNRLDGLEQFVQAFMKFVNCDIDLDTFEQLRQAGAIKIKQTDPALKADVDLISSELDQSQTQVLIDDLYQKVMIICGMPDRNGTNRTTGDTGQAVILRDGWTAAESRARDTELIFKRSEKRFLKLVLRILRDLPEHGVNLDLSEIEIKFTRNKTDNLLVKTQGLQNMLEAGVNPQIAFKTVGLFSDPEQAYVDSLEYLEKWKTAPASATPGNNKPGDQEDVD